MISTKIAKSKLRLEIKNRLSAMTIQERKRQSHLITEKVCYTLIGISNLEIATFMI